ncbi:MAG: hypothetical protein KGI29_01640 [Pseudomonadota bacterium]|nr:hypothetical protein [Pseudomonadota bacterium]MDE3037740.1 hypothetical protein [Pseudomonadota bacterium]
MSKYRCYVDDPETPVVDFVCAFLGGATGFFNFPGWLLIYFGWLSVAATLLLCGSAGMLFALYLAYESAKEKRQKT